MKKYLTIIVLTLCPLLARAQELEVSERWLMNERLIDLVESYERFSAFEGRSDSYSYLGLFRSPDSEVWCDYVASEDYGKFIPARKYVDYSKDLEDRSVRISRLRKGEYAYTSGRWRTTIEFDKQVEYEDSLGFTFSTLSPLVGGDFHITLECVWMPDDEEFRIEKVVGKENSGMTFPKGSFHIVQQRNEIDSRLLYNGLPLEFNEYGFVILPDGGTFDIDDDDLVLTQETSPGSGRYDVRSFSVIPKKYRIRGHAGFLLNPLTVETVYGVSPTSFGVDFGADAGISLSLGKSVKYVPYLSLGLCRTWFGMSTESMLGVESVQYGYILRAYDLSAKETFSFTDFTIGLSLASFEFNITKKLTAVADAGVKTYLNVSAQDKYELSFTAPEDVNLLDGYLSPNSRPFGPGEGEPNFWVMSLFGKLGADFSFAPGTFAYMRVGAEYGLGSDTGALRNVIYTNPNTGKWYDESDGVYPVVYRTNAGAVEDIKVHSFKNSITSIKRGLGLAIELGVKYKF
ncbi:MAG: hypothetical protein IKZ91_03895 [Bacteroidales bacterium]|nr:hypothetical protein [Bacteroidales bacterium]